MRGRGNTRLEGMAKGPGLPHRAMREWKEKMSSQSTVSIGGTKFRKELDREAVGLALNGEWERAAEVNRAILESFADDVEVMNRLTKALMELGSYDEANTVLDRVGQIAPYNNIARKNRARLDQMRTTSASATTRHARRAAGAPQLFIGDSGKSASATLRHAPRNLSPALVSPGAPVQLVIEHHGIGVYTDDGEYLGQVEPRLGHRLTRLIEGGNTYEAAIIGAGSEGISIMIHETSRHRSLQHIASFPNHAAHLPARSRNDMEEDSEDADAASDDPDGDDEAVIDEDELQAAWSENE